MDSLPPTTTPEPAQVNAPLLILRIASAPVFLYHGSAILFGAFGGPGPQGFSSLSDPRNGVRVLEPDLRPVLQDSGEVSSPLY